MGLSMFGFFLYVCMMNGMCVTEYGKPEYHNQAACWAAAGARQAELEQQLNSKIIRFRVRCDEDTANAEV